ncbi:MAG: hypothetical protein PHN84_15915 [Desulfuromonadaceae bacterium]|nr:hypothetical protein [Desulfuromonadaceae bacterium]MDD2856391.1 hypothetical protein [Desulfuromonadaceae bacterium]
MNDELIELHNRIDSAEEKMEAMTIMINCLLRSLEDHGIQLGDSMKSHMGQAANRFADRFGPGSAEPIDQLCKELVFSVPAQNIQPKNRGS